MALLVNVTRTPEKLGVLARRMGDNPLSVWVPVIALGSILRMLAATFGHNYDVDSYEIVAKIMSHGGNVYAETHRYNYGPIWFYILHWINALPDFNMVPFEAFRYKIAAFLTLVDITISYFLLRRFSLLAASLFFLNPISIFITGYHSQFDNLAVLIGFAGIILYDDHMNSKYTYRFISLVLLGISLATKHILFIFPLWLSLKELKFKISIIIIIIPYLIFTMSFWPYYSLGIDGIINNVIFYKSFNNGPFWSWMAPSIIIASFSYFQLFLSTLILFGMFSKRHSPLDSFCIYLISLVAFSSAITNQYLAICIIAISIYPNLMFLLYIITGTLFLAADQNGFQLTYLQNMLGDTLAYGYNIMTVLLFAGLIWMLTRTLRVRSSQSYARYG